MTELIAQAASQAAFTAAAQATGFISGGTVVTTGMWTDRDGSWFLNIVGPVSGQSGFWARLRWNGDTADRLPAFLTAVRAAGLTVYEQLEDGTWSSDGVTPAAPEIGNIGLIM